MHYFTNIEHTSGKLPTLFVKKLVIPVRTFPPSIPDYMVQQMDRKIIIFV